MLTLAFDIYGTLINPVGITDRLQEICADEAPAFARLWREKQLEYTFRRGLMKNYQSFPVCVRQALHFTAETFRVEMDEKRERQLLDLYQALPAFPDAEKCLRAIDRKRLRVFALTNGAGEDVMSLLRHNHLQDYMDEIVSVDAIRTFKPDPAVYQYFLEYTNTEANDCWLVSSNPFDVIGAVNGGLNTAWIRRDENAVFDPWEIQPDITLPGLERLQTAILAAA